MKLRIQNDSLRLRLSRGDLRTLAATGAVDASMHVAPGTSLAYRFCAIEVDRLGAELEGTTVTVRVPHGWVDGWEDDDRVGFEATQDVGDGRTLHIVVEKDFDCLHKRPEETDLFPHPHADAR